MNANKLIAIALAALLVSAGGAAALPSDAPDNAGTDTADDHAPDDPDATNETDDRADVTDADDGRDENASDGPPTELPEPVPDHVTQIHQLIRDKLSGNLTGQELGEAIRSLVGNGHEARTNGGADSAGEPAGNADEDASVQREYARANGPNAGPAGDLPQRAADHVSQLRNLVTAFLDGPGAGTPGDEINGAAS